jgi:hypothetical protein
MMNCSEKAKNAPARNEAGSAGNFPRSLLLGRISLARRAKFCQRALQTF